METALFFPPPTPPFNCQLCNAEQKRKKAAEWGAGCSTYAELGERCNPVFSIEAQHHCYIYFNCNVTKDWISSFLRKKNPTDN